MLLVNVGHDFSIVQSPDPFGAGMLIPIDKHHAEKKDIVWLCETIVYQTAQTIKLMLCCL